MGEAKSPKLSVIGVGRPVERVRKGEWIKHFPGGRGENNCPRFWYVRDGFGCIFSCRYCYLKRFDRLHPDGAEINPDVDTLYREVDAWLRRPGKLGLILGEVTDAWGWATQHPVRARNVRLIEMFRPQDRHSLIFLTKSGRVRSLLDGVEPARQVVLSWSINAPAVSEEFEMGARQAIMRIEDARACREAGWRVRVRLDPMIPIPGWEAHYEEVAERIANAVRPEQVTVGSWRPRRIDPMFRQASPEMRLLLEAGPDGRLRLKNRANMYRLVWSTLGGRVPQLSLCKEELDVQAAIYAEFAVPEQACNCLGASVAPVGAWQAQSRLPVLSR